MSDPLVTTDAAIEGGKAVGSAGGLLAIGVMLLQRFTKKAEVDDEREAKALEGMLGEMKLLNSGVAELKASLGILTERVSNTRADMDEIKDEHRQVMDRLAKLEGAFSHLSEQIAR
jgi:uncharacterized small protein (DUF1192 family)